MCLETKVDKIPPRLKIDFRDPIGRDRLEITHKSLLDILDNFKGQNEVNDIPKSELLKFSEMVWYEVNPGVRIRRRKTLFNGTLVFDTEIIQGGKFGFHFHSDVTEQCDVIEGELYDLMTQTSYKEGESVVFPQGIGHTPVALKYTVLRVYFD